MGFRWPGRRDRVAAGLPRIDPATLPAAAPAPGGRPSRLVAVVPLAALLLAGCSTMYPASGGTTQGQSVRSLYDIILVPAIVIFVLVEGLLIWNVVRYRGRRDHLPPQTHGNNVLEITWTILPFFITLGVFALSMQTLGKVDAKSANPAVVVDVTGRQWFWDFAYPDLGVKVSGAGAEPKIELPVGQTVRVRLHSDNVIHSFYVPGFLFKRDDIPGLDNQFDLDITTPGTYGGQCAEFCGFGHADMRFTIVAVSQADFQAWIAQQKAAASATPTPGPSLAPNAKTLEVSASTPTSFEQSSLDAPAGQPFAIHFTNKEAGVPHDVAIKDAGGQVIFKSKIVSGPADDTETAPALPAGSYTFFCMVHPNMQGTLTVH
ncbi:MAG TPA: cytochrome c oxidase subunit II [Candidatus Limnocylindrales bacterium]